MERILASFLRVGFILSASVLGLGILFNNASGASQYLQSDIDPINLEGTPPSPDITGGTRAAPGEYPYHVALIDARVPDVYFGYICGGALIQPQWVLTAGHCVQDETTGQVTAPNDLRILVGATNLDPTDGSIIGVSRVIPHPDFMDQGDKDIALIRLSQPVVLGDKIQTISLVDSPTSPLIAPGTASTVTGWGFTSTWGFLYADTLREVTVPIVSNQTCQLSYNDMGVAITENILCAGEDGLDACYGDSGGPLVVQNASHNGYLLAGVVSFGHYDGCGAEGRYGGYTRAAAFRDWIFAATGSPQVTFKIFLSLVFR